MTNEYSTVLNVYRTNKVTIQPDLDIFNHKQLPNLIHKRNLRFKNVSKQATSLLL